MNPKIEIKRKPKEEGITKDNFVLIVCTILSTIIIGGFVMNYLVYKEAKRVSGILENAIAPIEVNMPDGTKETKNVFLIAPLK